MYWYLGSFKSSINGLRYIPKQNKKNRLQFTERRRKETETIKEQKIYKNQ